MMVLCKACHAQLAILVLSCWFLSCCLLESCRVLSCKSCTGLSVQVLYRSVLFFIPSSCTDLVMLVLSDRSCHFDSFVNCAGLLVY